MRDDETGLLLAVSSSAFIGASFVVKKKGLRLAGSTGLRAGADESCWNGPDRHTHVDETSMEKHAKNAARSWREKRCEKAKMYVLTVEIMRGIRRQRRILVSRRTTLVGGHADKCVSPTTMHRNNAVVKRCNLS